MARSTRLATFTVAVLAAAAAQAQILPGETPEVYDAQDALVGRYIDDGAVAVHTSTGDVAIVGFSSSESGGAYDSSVTLWYESSNCSGTPHVDIADFDLGRLPNASGHRFVVARDAQLFAGPNAPVTITPNSRQLPTNSACGVLAFAPRTVVPVQLAGTLPWVFPFHIAVAASPAPALPAPFAGVGLLALVATGSAWLARRRRAR